MCIKLSPRRCSGFAALAIGCLFALGCGSGHPATYPVTGHVTFQGKPITTGQIVFYPAEGRPAMGAIAADGTYQLTTFQTDDGALPGMHRVTIQATLVTGGVSPKSFEEEMRMGFGTPGVTTWLAPREYAALDTTPLERQVAAGPNEINFDLP